MVAVALVCALAAVSAGPAMAGPVPWLTVARSANAACLSYDKKLFGLPGLKALQKVNSTADLTPALLKRSGAPFYAGELVLQQKLVHTWGTLGTPKEAAYRTAWARWLVLWKTLRIPVAEQIAASAKTGDVKGLEAAAARLAPHESEGKKLEKTLGFAVCQWD
jgi:hypothetical protein